MSYLELTEKQVYEIIENYIYDCPSTEKMHKLTMKVLKSYMNFDGSDIAALKRAINQYEKRNNTYDGDSIFNC